MFLKYISILKDRKFAKPIIGFLFFTAIFSIYQKNSLNSNLSSQTEIPIEIADVTLKNVPVYLPSLGTVKPENATTIKTQVDGQLIKITFKDGQQVKKGDLLAQIDSRSYRAQLLQYEGQLLKDQALLDNANLDLKRYKDLWKQNAISKQILDTQIALVKQNEGIVQLDQGLIENAKVNLSHCNITAPFNGQVGITIANEGDVMQANGNNSIVVINSLNPISVIFTVPEDEISKIAEEFKKTDLIVEIYDQAGEKLLKTGQLKAIDNQIDVGTGTIKLKAFFENEDLMLFPNQFVNVKLLVKNLQNALTIPTQSLQHGPNGTFVYLVNKNKVNIQPVEVELINGDITVIKSGVLEKDIVAVTGIDKLKNNAPVTIPGDNL